MAPASTSDMAMAVNGLQQFTTFSSMVMVFGCDIISIILLTCINVMTTLLIDRCQFKGEPGVQTATRTQCVKPRRGGGFLYEILQDRAGENSSGLRQLRHQIGRA